MKATQTTGAATQRPSQAPAKPGLGTRGPGQRGSFSQEQEEGAGGTRRRVQQRRCYRANHTRIHKHTNAHRRRCRSRLMITNEQITPHTQTDCTQRAQWHGAFHNLTGNTAEQQTDLCAADRLQQRHQQTAAHLSDSYRIHTRSPSTQMRNTIKIKNVSREMTRFK